MNRETVEAIASCDPEAGDCASNWHCVVMIVGGRQARARDLVDLGFNVLLVDELGRPIRYCKFRRHDNSLFLRENRALRMFGNDVVSAGIVPRMRIARTSRWVLQVCDFHGGESFSTMVRRMGPTRLRRVITDILDRAHCLSTTAARLDGGYKLRTIDLAVECQALLEDIESLSDPQRDRLAEAVAALPTIASSPQHGDLWPRNILGSPGDWRIIDFEHFGEAMVPLYDVFHLLRTCWETRESDGWLDRLVTSDDGSGIWRAVVGEFAVARELTSPQVVGAFYYYTLHHAVMAQSGGWHQDARDTIWKQLSILAESDPESLRDVLMGEHAPG